MLPIMFLDIFGLFFPYEIIHLGEEFYRIRIKTNSPVSGRSNIANLISMSILIALSRHDGEEITDHEMMDKGTI